MECNRIHFKKMKQKWFFRNGGMLLIEKLRGREQWGEKFKIFNSSDLIKATNDFHENNIISDGRCDIVYKGVLANKTTIAIMKCKIVNPYWDQKHVEQFVKEVIVYSRIDHVNIVKLVGCCLETETPILVYEFITNSTLATHLLEPMRACKLNWEKRLKITTDIANALLCLHSASLAIIHSIVKLDDILLTENYTAKVIGFSVSKLISSDEIPMPIILQEMRGYLDPEYLKIGQLTTKSDVYNFGVVLLELLTGRVAFRRDVPEEQQNLVAYSLSMMKQNKFEQIIDGNIARRVHTEQVKKVVQLAELCVKMNVDERPDMEDIVLWLESLMDIKNLPSIVQTEQNAQGNAQPLPVGGFYGITIDYSGGSTSVGPSSLVDQIVPPTTGG